MLELNHNCLLQLPIYLADNKQPLDSDPELNGTLRQSNPNHNASEALGWTPKPRHHEAHYPMNIYKTKTFVLRLKIRCCC